MISQNDIHCIAEENPGDSQNQQKRVLSSNIPSKNRKHKVKTTKQSKHRSNAEKTRNVTAQSGGDQPSEHPSNPSKFVTLKDLNEEDKQKIAQLIKELAKVGEEKENVVSLLKNERREFVIQMQKMEEEKVDLMGKRNLLVEEVKQCQHLLQYYQNLIAMQQNSILAQEKTREEERASRKKSNEVLNKSSCSTSSSLDSGTDDIRVHDLHEADDITEADDNHHSEEDFMQMSSRQYKDFLWQKKEKLQREQENLRKLLIASEESFAEDETLRVSEDPMASHDKDQPAISGMPSKLNASSSNHKLLSPSITNVSKTKSPPFRTPGPSLLPPTQTSSLSLTKDFNEEVLFARELEGLNLNSSVQPCSIFESNVEHFQNHYSSNPCDDSQILEDIFFVV